MFKIRFYHDGKVRIIWGAQLHIVDKLLKAMIDEGLSPELIWPKVE